MNNLDDSIVIIDIRVRTHSIYMIVIDDHMNKNPDIGNYKYYSIHYC